MVVGVLRIILHVPDGNSLKRKRQVVTKIKDRVRNKFNVSIAEVSDQDLWQRITLGITAVGNETGFVNSVLDRVLDFIEDMYVAPVIDHAIELIPFGDEIGEVDDGRFE